MRFCYRPAFTEISKEIDPYGEEDRDTKEEEVKEWIRNSTKEEVEAKIKEEINK